MGDIWEHDMALSIHAYYVDEIGAGARACERLLDMQLPGAVDEAARRNATFYAEIFDPSALIERIDVAPAHPGWSTFNPSIIQTDIGYLMVVRSSNYKIVEGRYVMPPEDAGVIRTANILCETDKHLRVTRRQVVSGPVYAKTGYPVDGMEDCRILRSQGRYYLSGTLRNMAPHDGTCRIALADLDVGTATATNVRIVPSAAGRHEKNWMPAQDARHPSWLYACYDAGKTTWLELTDDGIRTSREVEAPTGARHLRGGSQMVRLGNGWLAIVHEAVDAGSGRIYMHRFVWFDRSGRLDTRTRPFYIAKPRTIEFAAGLALSHDGNSVVVTFGSMDAEAFTASIDLRKISAAMSEYSTTAL